MGIVIALPKPNLAPDLNNNYVAAGETPQLVQAKANEIDTHKQEPRPQPQTKRKNVKKTTTPKKVVVERPPAKKLVGDKYDWMRAAGISPDVFHLVDDIVSKESGWQTQRWNSQGSGAYGLCQALPASKMASAGSDYMTNPVTQLKWCNEYAQQYGSWHESKVFRDCLGQCFSNRIAAFTNKDHTWW